MNTYAQIINGSHSYFGFLNFKFEDGKMKISISKGVRLPKKWEIDLNDITGLTTDEFMGAKRITFFVGNTEYILPATGIGITQYLEDHLYAEV